MTPYEEARNRRAQKIEFTVGLLVGLAEGVFLCWLAFMS